MRLNQNLIVFMSLITVATLDQAKTGLLNPGLFREFAYRPHTQLPPSVLVH